MLFHDHPRNASAQVRGDKIVIFSLSGGVEKEGIVTQEGKVLMIENQTFFPTVNRQHLELRKASKQEEDEFLAIRRQYILD